MTVTSRLRTFVFTATMAPGLRRFALVVHVTASVGWIGAIAAFLPLAITGLTRQDAQMIRAADLGMGWIGWYVLVPLSFASLLTGLVQSLGTPWGLFRHYWVLAKLLINVLSNIVLLLFLRNLGSGYYGSSDAPVLHGSIALLLLLVATALSVYKPRGVTPYGWRKQHAQRTVSAGVAAATPAQPRPSRTLS